MASLAMASATAVPVRTPTADYEVHIGQGLLPEVGSRLADLIGGTSTAAKTRIFIVTSPEIDRLWGSPLREGFKSAGFAGSATLIIPAGEDQKRLTTIERLCEEMASNGANRDSILVAFGGGVLGDLTGFLAAIYMRGIRFIQVPTTLLAQVDSSVGGKTGANLAAGKNLIGAFHQPLAVYADLDTLRTLPAAELAAGLQESVKAGVIRDRALFDFMETNAAAILAGDVASLHRVVADSVRMKAEVVGIDERENGLRMILNLGHTLGHAIEAATGYKQLLHGEAIAWGMLATARIAAKRGTVTPEEAARIGRAVRLYGPLKPFGADPQTLVDLTARDKKNRGGLRNFVLPVGIGDATVVRDVTEAELLEAAQAIVAEAATL